jgi:hypothetical protein
MEPTERMLLTLITGGSDVSLMKELPEIGRRVFVF